MKGICLFGFVAIRATPASAAEMITSLVFGETYTILEEKTDWLFIQSDWDEYKGWLSKSNHQELTEDVSDWQTITHAIDLKVADTHFTIKLGPGCALPKSKSFNFQDTKYTHYETKQDAAVSAKEITSIAQEFLGTPYLWGGKSILGIDCSGFTQMVFKSIGIALPRDSGKQAIVEAENISFTSLKSGDIVFFSKKEKINHVGIFIGNNQIIHASACVHIDTLTEKGIINVKKELTHNFSHAKRLNLAKSELN